MRVMQRILSLQKAAVILRTKCFKPCSRHLSSLPPHMIVGMPALSPTMETGTLSKWLIDVGDEVAPGDGIADITTDKASMTFESTDDFYVAKLLVEEGTEIAVGAPVFISVEDKAHVEAFSTYTTPTASTTPALADTPVSVAPTPEVSATSRIPSIKFLGKRSLSPEVASPVVSAAASPVTPAPVVQVSHVSSTTDTNYSDVPNTNMRKIIAKRLTESKTTVPHMYTAITSEIDEVLKLRKTLKKEFDINVSVNDIVIKAAALALRDVPEANAKWDAKKDARDVSSDSIDISVAVATPNGLITPIVTAAEKRGLSDINNTVKDLANRAKDNKLKPEEFQGGSFTISNLGMFGITEFSAVINPPQACILAVGGGISKVYPPRAGELKPRVATTMTVQLSSDRRVIDEAIAAQYLQVFDFYMSNPKLLMV